METTPQRTADDLLEGLWDLWEKAAEIEAKQAQKPA